MSKKNLRQKAQKIRESITDRELRDAKIVSNLYSLRCFMEASIILTYVSFSSEVKTIDFIKEQAKHKKIAVPFCNKKTNEIEVTLIDSFSDLEVGVFQILEPKNKLRSEPCRKIELKEIDLVLVPGLAFSSFGARLGYGRGYYDRFLPKLRDGCKIVGLAYQEQILKEVPTEAHDVDMDVVITDENIFHKQV